MAYRKRYGGRKRRNYAGSIARRVARKSYRGAMRMPKRRLAKTYATKTGQVAWRSAKNRRAYRKGRNFLRRGRRRRY